MAAGGAVGPHQAVSQGSVGSLLLVVLVVAVKRLLLESMNVLA